MLRLRVLHNPRCTYFTVAYNYISKELFHPDHLHVKAVRNMLVGVHDQLGLPWGLTISTTAILVRTVVAVPLYIFSERNQAKVSHVAIDCQKNWQLIRTKLNDYDYYRGASQKKQLILENLMFRRVFIQTCERNGCHPVKSSVTGIIQIPLWLTFTFSLRYLCGYQISQFDPNYVIDNPSLIIPCSSFMLPFICTLAGLANVELACLRRPLLFNSKSNSLIPDPLSYSVVRFLGWVGNLILFACCSFLPKALVIYWCTSSIHQLCISLLIMHPNLRKLLGLWTIPHEGSYPYRALLNSMYHRYNILKWLRNKKL
ncbi:unnamed protein product [Schistosoma turkestanicum]|nr:unnamed protein product [Schistosoma turkestanicum]